MPNRRLCNEPLLSFLGSPLASASSMCRPQEAMALAVGTVIQSHHGAPGSVPEVKGVDGPREVDRSETALAQQKAVQGPARVHIETLQSPLWG